MTTYITNKGRELAEALAPSLGYTRQIARTCSGICRLAATYKRLQENACNGYQDWQGNWDEAATKRAEKKESRIEEHIKTLCLELPTIDGKHIEPVFGGDPRGATIKLKMPDGRTDDWGREGICVPGS
jgi:hypothetical protein